MITISLRDDNTGGLFVFKGKHFSDVENGFVDCLVVDHYYCGDYDEGSAYDFHHGDGLVKEEHAEKNG